MSAREVETTLDAVGAVIPALEPMRAWLTNGEEVWPELVIGYADDGPVLVDENGMTYHLADELREHLVSLVCLLAPTQEPDEVHVLEVMQAHERRRLIATAAWNATHAPTEELRAHARADFARLTGRSL